MIKKSSRKPTNLGKSGGRLELTGGRSDGPLVVRKRSDVTKYKPKPVHLPPLSQKKDETPPLPPTATICLVIFLFIALLFLNRVLFGSG